MEIKDIAGIGKILPIDKLINVVSKGIGRVFKPHFDKKDIDTEVYRRVKLAEAKAEEMKIVATAIKENLLGTGGISYTGGEISISSPEISSHQLLTPSLEERTQERLSYQETKKQLNIENITAFAAEELKNQKSVNDESLDEDWTTRFFRIAEDISSEELQALWGKILAGEIVQSKSYSLRTLEVLRNMSKTEAETFTKFAKLALTANDTTFLLNPDNSQFLEKEYNITYANRLLLEEIGLITANDLFYQYKQVSFDARSVVTFGDHIILIDRPINYQQQDLPVLVFTKVGIELLKLIEQPFDIKYLNKLASLVSNESVKVYYNVIIERTPTNIKFQQPLISLPIQ